MPKRKSTTAVADRGAAARDAELRDVLRSVPLQRSDYRPASQPSQIARPAGKTLFSSSFLMKSLFAPLRFYFCASKSSKYAIISGESHFCSPMIFRAIFPRWSMM